MIKRVLIAISVLLVALGVACVVIVRSDWLKERIRTEVIAQAERATGGRVELGSFRFDWTAMTARFERFTIHGTEPAGAVPLLAVQEAVVTIRVISLLEREVSIDSVMARTPAAHLIVHADGSTNVPKPKVSGKRLDETILDLKVARFDLQSGILQVEREGQPVQVTPWSARGENLSAHATYDNRNASYSGTLAATPVRLNWQGRAVEAKLAAKAQLRRGQVLIDTAHVEAEGGVVDLKDGVFDGTLTAAYEASYSARKMSGGSNGRLRFVSPSDYLITGTVKGSARGIEGSAKVEVTPARIGFTDAHARGLGGAVALQGEITGLSQFRASGAVTHIEPAAVCRSGLYACPELPPADFFVTGNFTATGDVRRIGTGSFRGVISGPNARGEVDVAYKGSRIDFGHTWAELPNTRVDLNGTLGERLSVKLHSSNLADATPWLRSMPAGLRASSIGFEGEVSGPLANPRIVGHVDGMGLQAEGQTLDSLAADLDATSAGAKLTNATASYKGITVTGSGSVELSNWMPGPNARIVASVQTAGASVAQMLVLAGHKEIDVTGVLNARLQISGGRAAPAVAGDIALSRGAIYGQPYDSIAGTLQASGMSTQSFTGLFISGPKRVNITARVFGASVVEFNATSNTMALNQIALVRRQQPDILGFGKFHADGSVRFSETPKHEIQYDLISLNADASANGLELTGRNLGDARLVAQTKDGVLTARFDSNAAKAVIHGDGSMRLSGEYPLNGKITFTDAGINALATLIAKPENAKDITFDGAAQGEAVITGAMKRPESISADVRVTRFEVHPLNLPLFSIRNTTPLHGVLTAQSFRIESARMIAPQTDLTVGGSVALNSQVSLNLQMRGTVNLAIARTFMPDLASGGTIIVDAVMKGNWQTPDFSGSASIRNGDFHYADFTNGLTNANGELVFNGTRATIQSFSGESGGGRIDATGFAAFSGGILAFRLDTNAHGIRVRYPEGVSSVSDAHLTLAGTSQRSQASGTVTIHRISINPKSDAATILASTAAPVRTAAVRTGLIENLNLDVQIETAPDVTLETSVTQTIQADANLRLRGTVSNPAILGRINVTQGELVFFGNRYSINQGAISFYNPAKIDPILNIDLETKARGVDVILTVSGPVDKLNVSYRSDPPLQFSDIVALLATGRTPGDPTAAVRDLGQSQSFQQLGASELLGQAIANPVAGRLQRFFGVSRLKIDPQLTGITGSPQARLTIEQQVTPDILFTYITDVSSTSTQLIRVEWSYNRHWSAILTREENGYVGLDFAFRKSFR